MAQRQREEPVRRAYFAAQLSDRRREEQAVRDAEAVQEAQTRREEHERRERQETQETQRRRVEQEAREFEETREIQRRREEQEAREFEETRNAENAVRRQQQAENELQQQLHPRIPKGRQPYHEPVVKHSLGPMNVKCSHCHALNFDSEKLSKSTRNNPCFGSCCLQGQVKLPLIPEPPRTLRDLLYGISPLSGNFRKNIRQYNAAFAFTSMGVNIDHSVTYGSGPYCFKINGELHHSTGSLLPQEGATPQFA